MIKIIDLETEHLTEYEKKYVFTEAPTEKERVNVKRISLRAPDKRTYDFRKGADDEPEEDATEEPAEDVTTDDNTDVVEDPGDDLTDPAEDEPEVPDEDLDTEETPTEDTTDEDIVVDDETIETDDLDDTNGEDTGDDPNVNDTEEDDGTDDIVTDDDPAITDDEADAPDDPNTDDQDTGDENADEKDTDEEEKIHKQNLFKKFITLRTSIENYDAKLSSMIGIDADTHEMITEISEKLRSLAEMMYDYMVLKFKKNSYLESMLFYQRTVAAVNLCLDSLDKIRQISIMQTDKTKRKNK